MAQAIRFLGIGPENLDDFCQAVAPKRMFPDKAGTPPCGPGHLEVVSTWPRNRIGPVCFPRAVPRGTNRTGFAIDPLLLQHWFLP